MAMINDGIMFGSRTLLSGEFSSLATYDITPSNIVLSPNIRWYLVVVAALQQQQQQQQQ